MKENAYFTNEEITTFKGLFSKFCRSYHVEYNCEADTCEWCPINKAYEEIFEHCKPKYTETITLPKAQIDRINRLLAIESLELMTDDQLLEAGANTDQHEGVFHIDFEDGSSLDWDLCSGGSNYYDECIWNGTDGESIELDCSYELDDIEFDTDAATYKVVISPEEGDVA